MSPTWFFFPQDFNKFNELDLECKNSVHCMAIVAVPLNVKHELTRQRKWDKKETQEYMRHLNALKLDRLTSDPR